MDAVVSPLDQPAVQSVQGHDRFLSILFEDGRQVDSATEPACFRDLNLDQIVRAATAPKVEYNLAPFFYSILGDLDAIKYRHEVFRDLDDPDIAEAVESFALRMREVRKHLEQANKLYYRYQKEGWCQSAWERDPGSACKRDPSEAAHGATSWPLGGGQARFLKRQLSLPVSTMSQ
jgi:hypothetical protein